MPWEITYKIPQTHTYLIGNLYTVITILQYLYNYYYGRYLLNNSFHHQPCQNEYTTILG
jgi:hypothetical protein